VRAEWAWARWPIRNRHTRLHWRPPWPFCMRFLKFLAREAWCLARRPSGLRASKNLPRKRAPSPAEEAMAEDPKGRRPQPPSLLAVSLAEEVRKLDFPRGTVSSCASATIFLLPADWVLICEAAGDRPRGCTGRRPMGTSDSREQVREYARPERSAWTEGRSVGVRGSGPIRYGGL